MREHEMRMRVFRVLKARMRNMIMPATVGLGIGLAAGSCKTEGLSTHDAQVSNDVGGVPIYSAIFHDAATVNSDVLAPDGLVPGPDLAVADTRDALVTDDAAADMGRDAVPSADRPPGAETAGIDAGKPDLLAAIDGSDDVGVIVTKYIAPIPDAAVDTGGIAPLYIAPVPDAGPDAGVIIAKYVAPMPDAGPDGLVVRYMAPTPDAGADSGLAVLYMAPVQA